MSSSSISSIKVKAIALLRGRRMRVIFTVFALVFSVVVLSYLVYNQRDAIIRHEWTIQWVPAVISLALFSINLFLVVGVWVWIIGALGVKLDFKRHFHTFTISNLMRRLPGTVWYIAWRAQMYSQDGLSPKIVSLASGIELSLTIISCVIVIVIFAIPLLLQLTYGIWIAIFLIIACLIFLHPRFLGWLLKKAGSEVTGLKFSQLALWILVSVVTRLITGAILFSIANILTPVSWQDLGYVIGAQALVALITLALFFSPTNLGITEVSLSLVLSTIMPSSLAVIVSVANRILLTSYDILWALIALLLNSAWKKEN